MVRADIWQIEKAMKEIFPLNERGLTEAHYHITQAVKSLKGFYERMTERGAAEHD